MSINKVAEYAGVSNATVSRVINNHPRVSPETAALVRQAMQKVGYTPSDRRPGPKPQVYRPSTKAKVAFFVFGPTESRPTPAFEQLLRGVSQNANDNQIELLFCHLSTPDQLPKRFTHEHFDGLLLHGLPPADDQLLATLKKLPTVWLMGNRRRPTWGDHVMPDAYEIGSLAAHHLVNQGHRQLAFFNLNREHWPFSLYKQSFCHHAQELGAQVAIIERSTSAQADPWHRYSPGMLSDLIQEYLTIAQRPTGLFVADDLQVAMIQPALIQQGIRIGPGQTQIISCNNEQPFLVGLQPPPAEIDIRVESIGRRGMDQLMWRIANTDIPERIITCVEPKLIVDPA